MDALTVMAARDERQISSTDAEFHSMAKFFSWLGFVPYEKGSSHVDYVHERSCELDTKGPTGVKFVLAKSAKGGGTISPMRKAQDALDHFEKAFKTWEILGLSGKQAVSKLLMLRQRGGWEKTGSPPPNWWSWRWYESPWWKENMLKEKPAPVQAPERWPVSRVTEMDAEGGAVLLVLDGVTGWWWCPMAEMPRGLLLDEPVEWRLAPEQEEPQSLKGLGLRRVELRRPFGSTAGTARSGCTAGPGGCGRGVPGCTAGPVWGVDPKVGAGVRVYRRDWLERAALARELE